MILLDTSILIDSLGGVGGSAGVLRGALRRAIDRGERILLPSIVLYEWLRGPRRPEELRAQERLFPAEAAWPFGPREAALAANLYRELPRPRGREVDVAIAACAIAADAELWTLNVADFRDIPGV